METKVTEKNILYNDNIQEDLNFNITFVKKNKNKIL
jgi:hypothetical protein